MVKEAISRIIHSIRLHGRRMLWVSRNAQHESGNPKLSAINPRLELPVSSVLRNNARALLIAIAAVTLLNACSTLTTQVIGTSTQVLETKTVVRGQGPAQWHYFDFKIPETGSAMLRLSNGAKTGSSPQERVQGAKVTLNGEVVITSKEFNQRIDVLEVPVGLQGGANKLGVRLRSGPGKRLSVRINAPADKIVLTPVLSPVVLGRDPLRAQAKVTALGLPVQGVKVKFEVLKLGPKVEQNSVTGGAGIATTLMAGFKSGNGVLRATVADTTLSREIRASVVEEPTIMLTPRMSEVTVTVDSTTQVALTVNVLQRDGQTPPVTLSIAPDDFSGIEIQIPSQVSPNQRITGTIRGLTPGEYPLTVIAMRGDTGDTASASLTIEVRELSHLNVPSASPGAFPPTKELTPVTFHTLVVGNPNPPEKLFLDEVTRKGEVIAKGIAKLRDNGKDGDRLARDGFYAGTVEVASPEENGEPVEGEKYYQLRLDLLGKTLTSGIARLPFTDLPLKARASDPKKLVKDGPPDSDSFFADEVVVAALVGTSPQRVKTIVEGVGQSLNETVTIVGFVPRLDIYLVEIKGGESVEDVRQALKVFSAYDEIKKASPNFKGRPGSPYSPGDPYFPPSSCTGSTVSECQHYLQTIRAEDAWSFLETQGLTILGSPSFPVAVIDSGIDGNHPDLKTIVGGNNVGDMVHGTKVAGLIAGIHNNGGIAGVAPDTILLPSSSNTLYTTMEIDPVIVGAKIINISWEWTDKGTLAEPICDAVCNDMLVVTIAGNTQKAISCAGLNRYPGQLNNSLQCTSTQSSRCPATGIDATRRILTVGAITIDNDGDGTVDNLDSSSNSNMIAANMGNNCSNVQPWVEIYAPGEQIITTQSGGWGPADGTSFAAPLVSGTAAVLWAAYPTWTPQDVEACLNERGVDINLVGQIHPVLAGETDLGILQTLAGDPNALDFYSAVNHAPTDITLSNNTVPENFAGAVVGTLSAVDHCVTIATSIDAATKPDGVTFSVNDSRFEVVGRQLKLKSGIALDYSTDCTITGTNCTMNLLITATDAEVLAYIENFVINATEQENMCWPPHRGVPFNPSPPTIDGKVQEDVGWRGAHRLTYGDGTVPANLAFQGLKQKDDRYLYLSFEVRNDDTFDDDDLVVITFRKSASGGTAADDRRIFIYPLCDGSGAAGPGCSLTTPDDKVDRAPMAVQVWKDSANWTPATLTNWEVKVRSHSDGSSKAWYVELKVPTSMADGGGEWIDFADDFLFYFNVVRVFNSTAVEFRWPRNAPEVSGAVSGPMGYPFSPQEWGLGSKSNSATCKGLSLTWADIGTTNTPPSVIKYDDPPPNNFINTFFATVHNDTEIGGMPQPASDVRVRFRIANWGLPSAAEWVDVPAAPSVCPNTNDESNPTCPSDVPAATAGGPGTHTFNLKWIVPDADIPNYQTNNHQCILAEIDSLSDAKIVTKSIYRNMDFVSASKFERRATISTKGYGPPPQGMTRHQFDLHVTTREFPSKVDEEKETHGRQDRQISKLLAMAKSYDNTGRSTEIDKNEKTSDEEGHQVSRLLWVTHGYHHTGKYITINKNRYAIVDPAGSFGYVVTHVGPPLEQWNQRLGGAKKVAKNLYRLSLKPGEAAQVMTLAEPKEECKNLFQCICNWFRNLWNSDETMEEDTQ